MMSAKASGPQAQPDWENLRQQWWQVLTAAGVPVIDQAKGWLGEGWQGPITALGAVVGRPFQGETAERLQAAARQFLGWCNGLLTPAGETQAMPTTAAEWSNWLRQGAGPMFESIHPLLTLWQGVPLGADGFDQSGLAKLLAAAGQPAAAMQAELRDLLKLPSFGYARESQERKQQIGLALVDFQTALAAYNSLLQKISQQSFGRFESKLAEREEPGRRLDSVRAVYDLWIDAAEETYAEVALSQEFREIYGQLVNRQMALRQRLQAEIERAGAEIGMPTRSELNSVHQRLHALRRQVRELEARLDSAASATAVPAAVAAVAAKSAPRRGPRAAAKPTTAAASRRHRPAAKARAPKAATKLKVAKPAITRKPTGKPTSAKKSPAAVVRRALNRLA
jgi:class III poly(R)-hydroxyalkanoic acid synthase PhaE subunit